MRGKGGVRVLRRVLVLVTQGGRACRTPSICRAAAAVGPQGCIGLKPPATECDI